MDWKVLYEMAVSKNNPKVISPFTSSGYITCLIYSTKDNIYIGSNIISTTELKMSAEENALVKMITNQDYLIKKMLLVNEIGEILLPETECLYFLVDFISEETEILISSEYETKKIYDILPEWWGTFRIDRT